MSDEIDLFSHFGLPQPSEAEKKARELFHSKINEYKEHFGERFACDNLDMSTEEIAKNIDKCIKHNRKWYGYIVPEEDFSDSDKIY